MVHKRKDSIVLGIVFLATLLLRYNEYYTYREFNADKSIQLFGAQSILQGRGASLVSYDLNSFRPMVQPIIDWTPAYSYLAAGLAALTGQDLYIVSVLIDFLTLTVLWFSLLWFCSLLRFRFWQTALLLIFLGVSKTPLQFILSADLIGLTLFLIACCVNIQYTQQDNKTGATSARFLSLQFLLIVLMIFLKYSLLPSMVTLGLSLVTYSYASVKRPYKRDGFLLLVFAVAALGLLFLYNNILTGHNSRMAVLENARENKFYFSNLSLFNPFLTGSFFFLTPFYLRMDENMVTGVWLLTTLCIALFVLFAVYKKFRRKEESYFDHLLVAAFVVIIGFFSALSVYYPSDNFAGWKWTHVREYRYFAPVCFLVLLFFYGKTNFQRLKDYRTSFVTGLVSISLLYAVGLQAYYYIIANKAGAFENHYANIFDVKNYLKKHVGPDTYFISLTPDPATDARVSSLAAISGVNVAVSYYDYFPDSTFNVIFAKDRLVAPGKKIIVYYSGQKGIVDSINQKNKYCIEKTESGEELLVIKN